MTSADVRRRARQPATFGCFLLGAVTFFVGALILEWRYTFGIGLLLMVLPLTHVLFGTYDRRPGQDAGQDTGQDTGRDPD